MKAIIGVTPLVNTNKKIWYVDEGYMEAIRRAGGIPLVLPLCGNAGELRTLADLCDGFLFTGGHDVAPEMYGEAAIPACGPWVTERDETEELLLKRALRDGKPVLGICRGLQLINAVLGGSLYQDIPTQMATEIGHDQEKPYDRPAHAVSLPEASPLRGLFCRDEICVNSLHHQAVKELSPSLLPMALAPDGLIEAAYMPSQRFVWAVQWHPEFLPDEPESGKLFRAFVETCGYRPFFY